MGSGTSTRTTWLDGLGEWAWPGARPALELTPAAWVPALPLPRHPASARGARARLAARSREPLRLARLAVLLAIGAGTFVLSSGITHSGGAAGQRRGRRGSLPP